MKNLKLISKLATALMVVLFIGACEKEVVKDAVTYTISGTVKYPDYSGAAVAADGAVVYLKIGATEATTTFDVATVADANGNYTFSGLTAGSNFVYSNYDTENRNNPGGRLTGAIFLGEGALVEVADANVIQDFTLVSAGQADAFAINNTATGDWGADWSHSNIDFSFPYDAENGTYTGSFKLTETYVNFDPFNLSASSIEATIDVLTVHTDAPGGRDALYNSDKVLATNVDGNYTNLGCISRTLGASDNSTGVHLINDANRYSTFKSTKIEAYGDGYVATADFTLNGVTAPVSMFFKFYPGFQDETRQYSSFQGTFDFAAFKVFNIESGHIGEENNVTIDATFQLRKDL